MPGTRAVGDAVGDGWAKVMGVVYWDPKAEIEVCFEAALLLCYSALLCSVVRIVRLTALKDFYFAVMSISRRIVSSLMLIMASWRGISCTSR